MNSKWLAILMVAVLLMGAPGTAAAKDKDKDKNPQAEETPPKRIRAGVNAIAAKRVYSVSPDYPKEAKRQHIEGLVRLAVVIGKDGKVKELSVISGEEVLAKAAMKAVKKWRYTPTMVNHEPVEVESEIDVSFTLAY